MREEKKAIQSRSQSTPTPTPTSTPTPSNLNISKYRPLCSSDFDPLSPTTLLIPNLQIYKKRRRITPPSGECITTDLWKRLKNESRRHDVPRTRPNEEQQSMEASPSRFDTSSFVSCGPLGTPKRNLPEKVARDDDDGLNINPPKNSTKRKSSRSTSRDVVRTSNRETKVVQDDRPLENSRRESNCLDRHDVISSGPSKPIKRRVRFVDEAVVPPLEMPSQPLPFEDPFSAGPSKPARRTKKKSVSHQANDSILPSFKLSGSNISRICASTMDELISGMYKDKIYKKFIIDCRSTNEFKGGHIKGAKNISDKEIIDQELFSPDMTAIATKRLECRKRILLIFHCEFSAMRGPNMATYVRERDQELHSTEGLLYKEIYILDGGYAKYQGHSSQNCIGGYITMDSEWKQDSNPQFDINQFKMKETNGFTKKKTYSLIDENGKFNYLDEAPQSGPSREPRESQKTDRKLLWPTKPSSRVTSR